MRENKMADLAVEAPLAKFETDEWVDVSEIQCSEDVDNSNNDLKMTRKRPDANDNGFVDNFSETFSGSLEDLVNTFDEKITKCLRNYEEKTEKIAPVQMRSQEEIMNDCQMWWTITGNFGNMLPIDWTKSYTTQLNMAGLNLNDNAEVEAGDDESDHFDDDNEDLDYHSLIISSLQQEPMFTAEEVLEEIDEIMQLEDSPTEENPDEDEDVTNESVERCKDSTSHLFGQKLEELSLGELSELFGDLEAMVQEYSETLIQELAHRDELEYEKELKNTFISLLLAVQNKRRSFNLEKKRKGRPTPVNTGAKYLTTVIPYQHENGTPSNQTLQVLIKILQAINEDSPTVPTLLTDYILKVLCPT